MGNNQAKSMNYRPVVKDYIKAQGFYGAIVLPEIEQGRVLTTIRYFCDESDVVHKLSTKEANALLQKLKPDYLFQSGYSDVLLHGIPLNDIQRVFRPGEVIQSLFAMSNPDEKQSDAIEAFRFLLSSGIDEKKFGLTGSIALGFHNDQSDIDLIVYGRENFHTVRKYIADAIETGKIQQLDEPLWQETFERRDCELDFESYLFHEKRKFNKFKINQSKVDISLVLSEDEIIENSGPYKKSGHVVLKTTVIDDSQSFDLPARYYVADAKIPEIVSYTATYAGQAITGEKIEASGVVEVDRNGDSRLLVGTSREGKGEYIRVK